MRLRVGSKIILLSGALLLFSGCGGGGGGDTGGSDTQPAESVTYSSYDISIVDDNILHAKLTAVGCSGFEEIGKGKYRLTQCSKKPDIIVASGGYIDFDDDGEVDENDTAMGLPLMLDTRQTDKNDSFVVTPLTTLAASVSNDTELGTIAKKFGLKKEDLFSDLSKTENRKILQLLNAQYIAAQENGVIDVPRFLRTLKDKIIDDDTNDANASAVIENAVRKITEDTSMRTLFGGIGFNGFVTEINAIDPENLATTFYAKQTISPDKTVFVGFVYDEPIQNASVTIYIGDTKAGEASTDVNGKFRIAVETSLLEKDAIVRFEAELEDYKGDHVKLTSVTTTKALREIAKQRISPSDFIDFIISNVTTAEYVVAKKLNGGKEFSEPKQLEEKLVEAQVNHPVTIKKAAALLKAVIDTNETIGTDTNDTTESDTLTYIEGKIVTTDEGGIDIDLTSDEETEVENYTVKMENDPVLSQQLNSVEYTSAKTTLKTLADAGKAKFYSIDVSIEPNEIIKEYTRINFTPTTFERSEYERKSDAWVEEEKETATGNYDADGAFYVTDPRKEPEKIWIVSSATIYNDYLHKYYTLYTIAHGLYKPHDAAYYTSMFDGEYADKFTLDASMTSWNDLEKAINDNGYDFDGYHLTKDGNATNEHAVKWEHFEVEGKDFIRVVRDNDDDNRLYALDFANHAVYQKWELDEETIGKFKYELTITSFDLVTAYQFLPNNKIEEFFSKYKTEEERENAIRTFINDLITATELKEDDTTSDNGGSEESAESATSSNTSFAIPVTESMTFYEFEIEKEYDGIDIKKDLHTLEGGKVVSKEYEFDLEKGEWVEETHDDYILTAGGWVKESGLEETYVLNSDGSATIDDGFVVGIEEAIDLGNTTFTEAGSDGIEIAVPMPAGATMYKNSYTTLVDQYWIWDKKSVWVDGNRTEVTSFDELIQSQCGLNWFRGDSNGGIAFAPSSNEDGTFAKDNNGNYICNTAASSGTLVEVKRNADGSVNIVDENAGQWSIETVSGQQILVVRPENEA